MQYNKNPDLPSLESLQARVNTMRENLLHEGYTCYTGHKLTAGEAESLNRYVVDALSPTIYTDQAALSGILDRRHQTFAMTAERWEYVIGLGRYAHPDEAARFKEVSPCTQ